MTTKTITDDYEFADWIKNSGSYSNNFSLQGAKALQAYLEELSEDIGENIEFDPIAWCVEYSEYKNLAEAYKELRFDYTYVEDEAREYFQDNTTLIEFNGGVIVQDF